MSQGGHRPPHNPLPPPLHLQPVPDAVGQARRYVRDGLLAIGRTDLMETAVIGISELATNACLHARTPFTVSFAVSAPTVRLTVRDDSPTMPRARHGGQLAATGRGLRLLNAAGAWGVEPIPGDGKTIWFEPAAEIDESAFDDMTAGEQPWSRS